jgi:hypothetical protein
MAGGSSDRVVVFLDWQNLYKGRVTLSVIARPRVGLAWWILFGWRGGLSS